MTTTNGSRDATCSEARSRHAASSRAPGSTRHTAGDHIEHLHAIAALEAARIAVEQTTGEARAEVSSVNAGIIRKDMKKLAASRAALKRFTCAQLIELSAKANINLTIDAEEAERLELSLDVFEALAQRIANVYPQWTGFGLAVQAYQTRSLEVVHEVVRIARRWGLKFMVRLVKGAYWDAEIKRAQELGLAGYPVFTHKHHTDVAYLACAQALLAHHEVIYAQFATHNAGTIAALLQMAEKAGAVPGQDFELQRLHGMGDGVFREVLKDPRMSCRVYAPVGEHRDLLAYLVRRLLENGANSSFVHQLADPSVAPAELLRSPQIVAAYLERIGQTREIRPSERMLVRAAGLGDQQGTRCHVPGRQAGLEEAVVAAGGDVAQVQRGGAGATQAGHLGHHRFHDLHVALEVVALAEREARADQGFEHARTLGHADAAVVHVGAAALRCIEQVIAAGVIHHSLLHLTAESQSNRHGIDREAMDEIGGAVERIDDPDEVAVFGALAVA